MLGHEVMLLSTGDSFKKLPSDIDVSGKVFQDNYVLNGFRQILFRLTQKDIALAETGQRVLRFLKTTGDFDVIQLINEYPFKSPYRLERKIIAALRQHTKRLVILGCGDDYTYLSQRDQLPYHPMHQHPEKTFAYSEKYLSAKHKDFHQFVFAQKDLVITTDLDYHPAYINTPDYFGIIPNPINLDKLAYKPLEIGKKVVIFHGINRSNYYKKGNDIFEEALQIVLQSHLEKIELITVESLPYEKYITQYDCAHIIMDQVYAQDQGYNALEAMAQGKVVFTGAGDLFCKNYGVEKNTVAIATMPDAEQIAQDLISLIDHGERIIEISKQARRFIETNHDYIQVAKKYVEAWETINPA